MQGVQSVRCYPAPNLTSHLSQIALTPRTTCNFLSEAEINRNWMVRVCEAFDALDLDQQGDGHVPDSYFKTSCNYVSGTCQFWTSINSRLEIDLFMSNLRQGLRRTVSFGSER
jgi:hypothetical protein